MSDDGGDFGGEDGYDPNEVIDDEPPLSPTADLYPEDGDVAQTNGANGRTVVNGDPAAAAAARQADIRKGTVTGMKEKRVPDDKRTTTPYMTKYERARVLGTRALQIR